MPLSGLTHSAGVGEEGQSLRGVSERGMQLMRSWLGDSLL